MTQYIDKSAVIAEIERRVNNIYPKNGQGMVVTKILKDHYEDLKDFLNTLEVKEEVEVDLDKELDNYYGVYRKNGKTYDIEDGEECEDWKEMFDPYNTFFFASHFYELGKLTSRKEG